MNKSVSINVCCIFEQKNHVNTYSQFHSEYLNVTTQDNFSVEMQILSKMYLRLDNRQVKIVYIKKKDYF